MLVVFLVVIVGWWIGYGGFGVILFFLVDMIFWIWLNIYFLFGVFMVLLMCVMCLVNEL